MIPAGTCATVILEALPSLTPATVARSGLRVVDHRIRSCHRWVVEPDTFTATLLATLGCDEGQVVRYRSGDHYGWHRDSDGAGLKLRRRTTVALLSDPAACAGGQLELSDPSVRIPSELRLGQWVSFPAWVAHRVTPVTAGERWSLVGWQIA